MSESCATVLAHRRWRKRIAKKQRSRLRLICAPFSVLFLYFSVLFFCSFFFSLSLSLSVSLCLSLSLSVSLCLSLSLSVLVCVCRVACCDTPPYQRFLQWQCVPRLTEIKKEKKAPALRENSSGQYLLLSSMVKGMILGVLHQNTMPLGTIQLGAAGYVSNLGDPKYCGFTFLAPFTSSHIPNNSTPRAWQGHPKMAFERISCFFQGNPKKCVCVCVFCRSFFLGVPFLFP